MTENRGIRGFFLWSGHLKYINVRRSFAYIERSTDQGIRWAVYEPNGEPHCRVRTNRRTG